MQEVLRKTANLLKDHPALLAPQICVTWLACYFGLFRKFATHFVLHHFLIGHSVLGFSIPAPDPTYAYVHKAMIVLAPFSFAIQLLIAVLYVAALFVTARLVQILFAQHKLGWKNALLQLRTKVWRIAGFAFLLFVFFSALGATAAFSGAELYHSLGEKISFSTLVSVLLFLVSSLVVWAAMPMILRLIADHRSVEIPTQIKLIARLASIAVVAVLLAAGAYLTSVTPRINFAFNDTPLFRSHIVWPLISILGDLPLALLWIFLGVLLFDEPETVEIPSPS
ncbi:MAG: hypothetical protein P4K83_11935 [Terracidiphilus sp.]|nr:hypothetical protein [Terracidiphilus sp.]